MTRKPPIRPEGYDPEFVRDVSERVFQGYDVNEVLRLVHSLSAEDDTRLSILAVAFVAACGSCGVTADQAVAGLREIFDHPPERMPLFQ